MSIIKRIKLDHVEHSEYGVEHWCRVYVKYKGQFFKIWQLVLADYELENFRVDAEILNRSRDIKSHIKSVLKMKNFTTPN